MESPLPPCSNPNNCVLETHAFSVAPDVLYRLARTAILEIGAHDLDLDDDARRIDAVFRVFIFLDDLVALVEPAPEGSVLHVRSASRVGKGDLGVNQRRVDRLLDTLRGLVADYRP